MKGLNLDENLNRLIQENSDWAWEQAQRERAEMEKKQKTQGGTDGKKDEVCHFRAVLGIFIRSAYGQHCKKILFLHGEITPGSRDQPGGRTVAGIPSERTSAEIPDQK